MNHLLLLLPLLAISFLCIAGDATQLVYDTENHEVTSEESYYVLPVEHGTGGGLRMMFHTWRRCNYLVSQASSETDIGLPLRFVPSNESSGRNILVSTNITISFHIPTTCIQTMYWHVGDSRLSQLEPRDRVAVGKDEGASYPVPLPSEFVFRIERYNGKTKGYKLVSCAGEGPWKELGLSASENKNWLTISNSPFVVEFKKAQYPYA
ncbi:hypothetical protein HU200_061115 [Digitaria exilis]|uniref:Uncharacterized protein n=1 Tax=Digitaria exilis TaxID=1010633 RepID=A0A835A8C6_9POAL|nr:hypothetical protein HU200_061115 [Digitaria exilis]